MRPRTLSLSILLAVLAITSTFLSGCNTELARARELKSKQDFLFAAIFYEKALKRDPDNEEALKELTQLYCEKLKVVSKCFEKSELLYRRYKNDNKIKGWYRGSLLTVAKGMFQEQRLKKAGLYLRKYRKLEPNNAQVLFMLGNSQYRLHSKPPFSSNDKKQLKEAMATLMDAVKNSKPDTEVPSAYNSKKMNILHWEAYVLKGRVYEMYIAEAFKKWMKEIEKKKAAAAAKAAKEAKKKKKRRRRRRRKKKEKEEEPKFPANKEHLEKAIDAYTKAAKVPQSNKYKRFVPYFRIAMLYANILRDNEKAVKYLHKAESYDENNASIVGNLKMIYDRLKEQAEKDKNKKLMREYKAKAAQYDSKMASLRAMQ